ncbi:MAG: hypothetical protein QOJ20_1414 [Mycobacterium sp.]|jgi:hypothetical protein|nr:hypothetical protein [Mycobacterium sp.]
MVIYLERQQMYELGVVPCQPVATDYTCRRR